MARDWWKVVLAASVAVALGAVCAFTGTVHAKGDKKEDPAAALRTIEAAGKLLDAGKADRAAQTLTATLTEGNLPPAMLAKALYLRGLAYRQDSKPAQAISDLSSALWLQGGLGPEERARALEQRAAAYADAGLNERGEAASERTAAREAAREAADPPAEKSSGNWLSSLFGASPPAPPAATGATAKRLPPAPLPAPKSASTTSGWASGTKVREAERAAAPPPAETPEPEPAAAEGGSGYQVQLAAVRTKAQAVALADKAKREHVVLASARPTIDQAVLGNMGAFYRVRFGPFASVQQTQSVCAQLKDRGLDCMPVTP